jgi:hypothetical protein
VLQGAGTDQTRSRFRPWRSLRVQYSFYPILPGGARDSPGPRPMLFDGAKAGSTISVPIYCVILLYCVILRHTHTDLTVRTRTATSGAKQHVASADGDKLPDAKGGLYDMPSRDHPSLQDPRAGSGISGLARLPAHPGGVAERPMDRARQPRRRRLLGRGLAADRVGLLI